MADVKSDAKEVTEEAVVEEETEQEQAIFGFNDRRYADIQLRLIVSDPSAVIHGPQHNHSPASRIAKVSESGVSRVTESGGHGDGAILHVSSLLLGQSSQYFRNILDRRSLTESSQVLVYLRPQEVATFIVMIKSLYCSQVKANTTSELMAVFRMANRFEVLPCLKLCCERMQKLSMTFEMSVQILDACETPQKSEEVKELLSLASSFLCRHFQWTQTCSWDSAKIRQWKTLSPHVLRILLGSDCLLISYEEKAFQMLETWISANCKSCNDEGNEKSRALCEFGQLIRWPLMEWSCLHRYLKKFDSEEADHPLRTLIIEALLYRASRIENAQKAPEESGNGVAAMRFRQRAHYPLPVTFIHMNLPYDHGIVFFSVTVSELDKLPFGGCRYSERFWMGPYGMQWKMRRPNFTDGYWPSFLQAQGDLLSGQAIFLAVDYVSAPSKVEEDHGRPLISLSVWHAKRGVYVDTETRNGWFVTRDTCESDGICSFRAVLENRAKVHS